MNRKTLLTEQISKREQQEKGGFGSKHALQLAELQADLLYFRPLLEKLGVKAPQGVVRLQRLLIYYKI